MIYLQRVIRLQAAYAKHLRKLSFSNHRYQNSYFYNFINFVLIPRKFCHYRAVYFVNLFSTSAESYSEELVDVNVFEKVCEETLESLTDFFEELIENKETLKNADVTYSGGVLTINLGSNLGTYVINRQSPNRQIWLSSPTSGPKRYDYVVNQKYWIYKHDMVSLHKQLQIEISDILGENIDFSKCLYSKV